MTPFVAGLGLGAIVILFIWIIFLEIRIQFLSGEVKRLGAKDEGASITKAVSGLTSDELNALVSKDLGSSKSN